MRIGVTIVVAFFALMCLVIRTHAQVVPGNVPISAGGISRGLDIKAGGLPSVEQTQDPINGLTDEERKNLTVWTAGLSFLTGMGFYFMRQFDWQRLVNHQTCTQCLTVHNGLGSFALICDITSISSLFYLAVLPIGAALNEGSISTDKVCITFLLFVALGLVITAIGFFGRIGFTLRSRKLKPKIDWISTFLSGGRIVGLGCSMTILARGVSLEAAASQFDSIVGYQLGENIITAVGIGPIRDTAIVLFGSIIASGLIRWALPFVFGSRPLILLSDHRGSHPVSRLART